MKKILIVDDDLPIAQLVAEFVKREGYEAEVADSIGGANALLARDRFDGFLLDIDMPNGSGMYLCRIIRSMKEYEAVPILFITGTTSNLEEAFASGADDLINKPVDYRVLRVRLNAHMQKAETAVLLNATRRVLDLYVSKRTREIAEAAAQQGVLPDPVRRQVTVLFTDIRGFTSLSEDVDPAQLFSLISGELATQVNLVYQLGGYVDKFDGDGLMAIFDGDDMVMQACLCATQILKEALASASADQRIKQLGIGIHVGPVVIGNLGSAEHLDYSVIGSTVNLAARLCGHAQPMTAVVSREIRAAAPKDDRLSFEDARQVPIRGLRDLVQVYTLRPRIEQAI